MLRSEGAKTGFTGTAACGAKPPFVVAVGPNQQQSFVLERGPQDRLASRRSESHDHTIQAGE